MTVKAWRDKESQAGRGGARRGMERNRRQVEAGRGEEWIGTDNAGEAGTGRFRRGAVLNKIAGRTRRVAARYDME